MVVLPRFGVVLVASPPALVLDLAEGCCRPRAPLAPRQLPRAHGAIAGKSQHLPRWVRKGRLHLVADEVRKDTVEHEWLLHLFHSHSSTYHHAIAECGQKLMVRTQPLTTSAQLHPHPETRSGHAACSSRSPR